MTPIKWTLTLPLDMCETETCSTVVIMYIIHSFVELEIDNTDGADHVACNGEDKKLKKNLLEIVEIKGTTWET
jgi:hypothetical protein